MRFARRAVIAFAACCALLAVNTAAAETGYGGTIHYRDGTSVQFEWFGDADTVRRASLSGQMGARNVELDLHEVREIIFTEASKYYYFGGGGAGPGQMIVVNHAGERFNINGGVAGGGAQGELRYVHQDAITRVLRATRDTIHETVASITIGAYVGTMKRNPETGEFFPPTFLYDPYTGHQLVWATP